MTNKYELTRESTNYSGKKLYRIKALEDFGGVEKGDLGGFVEKESNLSQHDNAWVYGDALVYGNAEVYGDARVFGDAEVYGDARVSGNAEVSIGKCTIKVINLINLCEYNITAYNDYIKVGCKVYTRNEWLSLLEDCDLFLDDCKNKKSQQKLHFYVTSLLMDSN